MDQKMRKIIVVFILLTFSAAIVVYGILTNHSITEEKTVEQPLEVDEPDVSADLTKEEIQEEIVKCEKETIYFQGECYTDLATLVRDPEICDKVEEIYDAGYQESKSFVHKGVCLGNVAEEMDYDFSLCDVIEDTGQFDTCMMIIANGKASETYDINDCDVVKYNSNSYANCLAATVRDHEDTTVCDLTENDSYRDTCVSIAYQRMSKIYESVDYCSKIEQSALADFCVGSYAKHFEDLSVCDTLGSDQSICVCYNMYFDEVNEEVCGNIETNEQKSSCNRCVELNLFK